MPLINIYRKHSAYFFIVKDMFISYKSWDTMSTCWEYGRIINKTFIFMKRPCSDPWWNIVN
jgi:hypothetical protein